MILLVEIDGVILLFGTRNLERLAIIDIVKFPIAKIITSEVVLIAYIGYANS